VTDSEKPDSGWPDRDRREPGDRRLGRDRRSGADRRIADHGRAEGERRSGTDRRQADRRTGVERRSDAGWQALAVDALADREQAQEQALVDAARDARERAQAAYSQFKVGAALETIDGRIVTGCNIENATYGLTVCAERVALFKALSDGHVIFSRIVIVADTASPTPPCGPCRQLLWEYGGDLQVVLANLTEVKARYQLSALLPLPFDRHLLT
jgi:cytidine deaminase